MINFCIGFLLFCACITVAIRMWRQLVVVFGAVAVVGIVLLAISDITNRMRQSPGNTHSVASSSALR